MTEHNDNIKMNSLHRLLADANKGCLSSELFFSLAIMMDYSSSMDIADLGIMARSIARIDDHPEKAFARRCFSARRFNRQHEPGKPSPYLLSLTATNHMLLEESFRTGDMHPILIERTFKGATHPERAVQAKNMVAVAASRHRIANINAHNLESLHLQLKNQLSGISGAFRDAATGLVNDVGRYGRPFYMDGETKRPLISRGGDLALNALRGLVQTADDIDGYDEDPNESDAFGWSPVHYACASENQKTVLAFLEYGVNLPATKRVKQETDNPFPETDFLLAGEATCLEIMRAFEFGTFEPGLWKDGLIEQVEAAMLKQKKIVGEQKAKPIRSAL